MSPKNLNASNKTHNFLLSKLKNKKIYQIYNKFEKELKINEDFIVAVSGGPDSLALSFLSKIYSIKKSINVKYLIVDHKLRADSTKESKFVKMLLKKIHTKLNILTWTGKKPKSNIQSIAREKRYTLLINKAKKLKINNILLGHHKDDLFENFFIRILRGSGLNGIASFDKKSQFKKTNFFRPLLDISKKDLIIIAKKIFGVYVQDPSNEINKFKRVKIRKLIKELEKEGLDLQKLNLTLKNLKFANESIKFFIQKNLVENSNKNNYSKSIILNKEFFNNPEEIVFRSLTEVIQLVGKRYYPVRGKKIIRIINKVKNDSSFKATIGNCLIKKINHTIIVSKEH